MPVVATSPRSWDARIALPSAYSARRTISCASDWISFDSTRFYSTY